MQRVLIVNGPNLNLLGLREPDVYGSTTLQQLEARIERWAADLGLEVETYQSNHEGAIIDRLHDARDTFDGVVLNAGAYSHYSYAIHDAIIAAAVPTVEIHISNIRARETWRAVSVTEPACDYSIFGRGIRGYRDAMARLANSAALPPQRIAYGSGPDQFGELRVPPGGGPHPIAVLVHGGFWRDEWTGDLMDGLAIDLVERGWAAWNLEYRRVGGGDGGGGWPATFEDVTAGMEAISDFAGEHRLDAGRVVAVGHSSGGQLALCSIARARSHEAAGAVVPSTVIVLAGITDLDEAHRLDLGPGAVEGFLAGTPGEEPDRYAAASPHRLLPLGSRQIVVHGAEDRIVPPAMSENYAAAAAEAGDETELLTVQGADHFDVIDPAGTAWAEAMDQLDG